MVKEVERVFFFACLQFSSYDVTVLKEHRTLPATSSENPKRYSRQQNSRKDDLVEMVSPLDSGDWFNPGVYDVKPSTEEEGEDAKEADVCNETENKMNSGKCKCVWFLILPYY